MPTINSTGERFDVDYTGYTFRPLSFSLSLPDVEIGLSLDIFAVSSDNPDLLVSSWWTSGDGIWDFDGNLYVKLDLFPFIDFFDLVISPVESLMDGAETASSGIAGESKRPIWPVFRVPGFDIETGPQAPIDSETDQSSDEYVIELPSVQPVTFSGYIDLCEQPLPEKRTADSYGFANEGSNTNLPISFYSKKLSVDDRQTSIIGSYNTRANAEYDANTGSLKFAVDLLPGQYEVVVSPPLDSPCEVFAKEVPVSSEVQTEVRFQMARITYLEGTLKTAKGEPVFGAVIHAQALNRDGINRSDNPVITRFNRSNDTKTDEKGRYRLPLDLGSYDIIAKPPVASQYGWKVITDIEIDNRSGTFNRDIVLDAPVPIEGILSYAITPNDSTPLSGLEGAEVHVFALIRDIDGNAGRKRNVAIGRATADRKSFFTALISPSLQSGL